MTNILTLSPKRIRETGANPVQSRCCKFHYCQSTLATAAPIQGGREGGQDRDKPENLPFSQA